MKRTSAAAALLLALASPTVFAQDEAAKPAVVVESIRVEPEKPAADTLCKLTVTLANHGDRTASQLGFQVELNGQNLVVYDNQLFMYPVEPGESTEIPLYNFWTTETSRPTMPADGGYEVKVTLREAQWTDISMDEEQVEVWKPLGPVEGLPSSASVTLETPKP
ncbi:MAG: hypothetical protein R2991_09260 [Thermoanaerobaculia bacterium]